MGETTTNKLTTPKVVALIALLLVFAEGVNNYWAGYALLPAIEGLGYGAIGILQIILAGVLMIALIATIVDLKFAILKKLYHWLFLLVIGLLMLLLELSAVMWDGVVAWNAGITGGILAGLLVLIAAGLEIAAAYKSNLSPAKLVVLAGVICAIVDVIMLILTVNQLLPGAGIPIIDKMIMNIGYYIVVAIISIILLCVVLQNKIKVKLLKFSWWLVLIIGFIFYMWIGTVTGIIILIAFIIMIRE